MVHWSRMRRFFDVAGARLGNTLNYARLAYGPFHNEPEHATGAQPNVTYTFPNQPLGNKKMAENWRARQDSNLRPQA